VICAPIAIAADLIAIDDPLNNPANSADRQLPPPRNLTQYPLWLSSPLDNKTVAVQGL
jgi:hypothetical protein